MRPGVEPGTARRLRTVLAHAQVDGRLPSVVAAVARDGEPLWCEGYGAVPGDPSDRQYRIGSITKTLTAVLVLQLVADGELTLDTPLSAVLGDVPYGDRRIADLLSHAAGLPAEPDGAWWERSGRGSFDELIAAEQGRDPVLDAGQRYHYTNLSFALLGEVVARLRGSTWWEAVQTRLLQPLGMSRTSYDACAPSAAGWSVHPYRRTLLAEPTPDTGAMAPAGQLWSTAADLLRWGNFLVDGDPAVLERAWLDAAALPRSGSAAVGLTSAHGLGLRLHQAPVGTLVGHSGSMPGFLAGCFVDRPHGAVAVVLANATSGLATADFTARLLGVLEECEPALPAPWTPSGPAPALIDEILGLWFWGATGHELSWEGEALVTRVAGSVVWTHRLVTDANGGQRLLGASGYQDAETLTIVRRPDGGVSHLDAASFILTRTPYETPAP